MLPPFAGPVRLREIFADDLPRLYQYNLDPVANRLAATIPRDADAFAAQWRRNRGDRTCIVRAVLAGDELAGHISCFRLDDLPYVGYWLGQEFWGQGIASRALVLFLAEVHLRPMHARVATCNAASLRVLQKSGFVIRSVESAPADDRNLACDEALLVLH